MLGTASAAVAQQAPPPAAAAAGHDDDRRTKAGATSAEPPAKKEGPAHVPPDASGIDLTTLETKDLDLLYFDPVQTYLTPYIARAYENALRFHEKKFGWTPCRSQRPSF